MIHFASQVEAFVQFFLGSYSQDLTYQDNLLMSLKRNLSSVRGFWFDCVTSIPWSYMDLHVYLVWCCLCDSVVARLNHSLNPSPSALPFRRMPTF
jgi:hypothetical protein